MNSPTTQNVTGADSRETEAARERATGRRNENRHVSRQNV